MSRKIPASTKAKHIAAWRKKWEDGKVSFETMREMIKFIKEDC